MKTISALFLILMLTSGSQSDKLYGNYRLKFTNSNEYSFIRFSGDFCFIRTINSQTVKRFITYGSGTTTFNHINEDIIIQFYTSDIKKDTIKFTTHNRNSGGNYLDISSGNGGVLFKN